MTRLGLSSAAARDASLDELLSACARRGLAALELREGDAHGIDPDGVASGSGVAAAERAAAAGVTIVGYRSAQPGRDPRLARLARMLHAPVLVDGPVDVASRIERAVGLAAAGADVAIVLPADAPTRDAAFCIAAGADLAWDADPAGAPVAAKARMLLREFGPRLRHIRLIGGGPEAEMQEGQGVGELMACLALEGFDGAVVLAPSSDSYRVAWRTWLGHGRGWGCGSRRSDRSPLPLATDPAIPGGV